MSYFVVFFSVSAAKTRTEEEEEKRGFKSKRRHINDSRAYVHARAVGATEEARAAIHSPIRREQKYRSRSFCRSHFGCRNEQMRNWPKLSFIRLRWRTQEQPACPHWTAGGPPQARLTHPTQQHWQRPRFGHLSNDRFDATEKSDHVNGGNQLIATSEFVRSATAREWAMRSLCCETTLSASHRQCRRWARCVLTANLSGCGELGTANQVENWWRFWCIRERLRMREHGLSYRGNSGEMGIVLVSVYEERVVVIQVFGVLSILWCFCLFARGLVITIEFD